MEQDNPGALVDPSYIRGSGTSQATALTSGLVALLLDARPSLTPDQVKAVLTGTAVPLTAGSPTANDQGAGRVRLDLAVGADAGAASQQTAPAAGTGSLEASRAGRHVMTDCDEDGNPDVIEGEITARCQPWDSAAWTGTSWTGTSWTGTSWTGTSWTGTSWTGTSWTGGSWTGTSWTGTSWTGTSWTGTSWTGTSWTGTSWTGTSWTGTSWTGTEYAAAQFEGDQSSSYGVGEGFMTGFWGDHPKYWRHLRGEVSNPVPPGCNEGGKGQPRKRCKDPAPGRGGPRPS